MENNDYLNAAHQEEVPGEPSEQATPETTETATSPEPLMANEAPETQPDELRAHEEEIPQTSRTAEDLNQLSREELVAEMRKLIRTDHVNEIKDEVELIRVTFYKKFNQETEQLKKQFIESGGAEQDFHPQADHYDLELKDLLQDFRKRRSEINDRLEKEKNENLHKKQTIIEDIKNLVQSQESLNKTFEEFRELQNRWRQIGLVPQSHVKDLWDSYHYQVEAFYNFVKINRELRDLDLKRNLEAKIKLCEKAEELSLGPEIIPAFRGLQELHEQWREIGPVPAEMKSQIWERFSEASKVINKKYQDHFENLKKELKANLDHKIALCEKAEEISRAECASAKEWDDKSNELIELQKVWRTIGFAPKKDNNAVYERFRQACDVFFERKRDYFSVLKEEYANNLQLKTDLCIQAEAIKDSTDWKRTTEVLINLQRRWKEIGPVPARQSEALWKRFRQACDDFFKRKETYFSTIDARYEENLRLKNDLIAEIEAFDITDNVKESFEHLKDFQRRWTEIGFVPLKDKEEVQSRYREAINKKFDQLRIDESRRDLLKYKSRFEDVKEKPQSNQRLKQEREKLKIKLKKLEGDITIWENNIGFFAHSKNADAMKREVEQRIEDGKKQMEEIVDKLNIIDDLIKSGKEN